MHLSNKTALLTYQTIRPSMKRFSATSQQFSQLLLLLLILLATGCASLPSNYPRTESTAIQNYQSTTLGQRFNATEMQHPDESGFAIIRYGRNAFSTRIAMTDLAEKTLDLQYYIWASDETGRILAERLVRAADRGVRVRLLVDDMGVNAGDEAIATLDAHPNIEIRIFNPFANRKSQIFDFISDFGRVNHRMHNKILVMDNSFVIVGGRNIGDHYFSVDPETNFRDLDIAAVGPVVRDVSNVFDHFWNGSWAVPIAVLVNRQYTDADLQPALVQLRKKIAEGEYPYDVNADVAQLRAQISAMEDIMIWAPGKVIWDDPASVNETGEAGDLVAVLRSKLDNIQESYIIESAYFVVGDRGVNTVKKLVDKGVEVRIMTNSLASNDVLAAHAGHANYRKQLLQAGAEIYELRADSGIIKKNWVTGKARAGLHTKAMVFDNKSLFIGSFNLDPRSAILNTEAGIYVESPELSTQVLAYMNEGVLPQNSYRLLLDEDEDLVWVTVENGVETRYHKDPKSSFGQRFSSWFIGILPIESQL